MAGIVPKCWLEYGFGTEEGATPKFPEADMLAAHDMVTTYSRIAQQKLGKLVNQAVTLRTQLFWTSCQRKHAR